MNARIINLRTARKRRAREEAKSVADQRAVDFGRTKAEREATETEAARIKRLHEAHRREDTGDDG